MLNGPAPPLEVARVLMQRGEPVPANITRAEQRRILAGRRDWRADTWQDHCGAADCVYCGPLPAFEGQL